MSTKPDSSQIKHETGTLKDIADASKPLADYTALRAYTGTATTVRITSTGIAGFFSRDSDVVTADNGGTVIVDAAGRRWKRVFDGVVSVKWFGATGSDNENLYSFISTILSTTSETQVSIQNKVFAVSPDITSTRDIVLVGTGNSVMTGYVTKAKLEGITRKTEKTLQVRSFPGATEAPTKISLFEKRFGNGFYSVQPLANGYVETLFYPNAGTSVDSIGTPWELTRAIEVNYMLDCLVAFRTPSASTSTDLNWGIANGIFPEKAIVRSGTASPRGSTVLDLNRVNAGGSITYTLNKLPSDNFEGAIKANVAFYTSASSSGSVTIKVNGTLVATTSLVSTSNVVKVVEFELPFNYTSGLEVTPVILVENTGASQAYVICANLYKLNKVPSNNVSIDYFRVFDSLRNFRNTNGACDYAILDKDTGLYCGSAHGGETQSNYSVRLDGIIQNNADASGTFKLFKELEFIQSTSINSKLTGYVIHTLVDNGYDLKVNLSGSIRAERMYTAMSTADEAFIYVTYPEFVDVSALASGAEYSLPNSNQIVMQTAGSGSTKALQLSMEMQLFDESYNGKAGSFLWKSVGSYHKLYYAPVYANDVTLERLSFATKHRFNDL